MIADIMKKESRAFWSAKLDAAGVPNGPLNTVPQVLELAQTAALGMFAQPYAGSTATLPRPAAQHRRRARRRAREGAEDRRAQRQGLTGRSKAHRA